MTRTDAATAGLDYAAGLLTAAGCHDVTNPTAGTLALSAAHHLQVAGAQALQLAVDRPRAAIAAALRTLAELPDDVFGEDAVADAVDDAQDALAATNG